MFNAYIRVHFLISFIYHDLTGYIYVSWGKRKELLSRKFFRNFQISNSPIDNKSCGLSTPNFMIMETYSQKVARVFKKLTWRCSRPSKVISVQLTDNFEQLSLWICQSLWQGMALSTERSLPCTCYQVLPLVFSLYTADIPKINTSMKASKITSLCCNKTPVIISV